MESFPTDPDERTGGPRPVSPAVWLLAARPKTLLAACAPVIIGTAMAVRDESFHAAAAACALLSALLIQIGTNFYNDYADFRRGADAEDRLGPQRATQAGLVKPRQMWWAATIAFALAFVGGLYLIVRGGWPILAIGLASIGAGYLYSATRFALAYTGLADLFVLVFFGPVAVGGTYFVQALSVTPAVVVAGIAPGLLSTAILLVNNIRDVEQDRAAAKQTLVVRLGRPFGVGLYLVCLAIAALVPAVLFVAFGGTAASLAAVLVLPLGLPLFQHLRSTSDGAMLNVTLASTARLLFIYSIVFAIGWNTGL